MADQVAREVESSNSRTLQTGMTDAMRVRSALISVSNGISSQNGTLVSLPSPSPTPSMTESSITPSLKKLGRKKKEPPIAMITKPVQESPTANMYVVRNRFKHTKPSAHALNPGKTKNALDTLADMYGTSDEGPPAKQCRIEESTVHQTPRSVVINQSAQLQQVTKASLISPSLVTKSSMNTAGLSRPPISLCPSCNSKDTIHDSNAIFKCNACSRTYVPITSLKGVVSSSPTLIPAATFYNTSQAVLAQQTTSKAPILTASRFKKPAETIDLVSSEEDDDDDDDEEEESDVSDKNTTATAPIANNTPVRPTTTLAAMSNTVAHSRIADRMQLRGGVESNNTPGALPTRQETYTPNEYIFHCNKVMFGELYGQSVAPTRILNKRMYLSLECLIVRDSVQSSEKYTLSVGANDVQQMFVYFGKVPSFVAIETAKKFASVACKRIGKEVLVPHSELPKRRYILLALNSAFKNDSEADTERRNLMAAVSPWAKIHAISHKDAINLMTQAGLDVNQKEICYGRTAKALGPIQTLFVYPPSSKSGGIPITTLDVACLDEGTYLNDVIIDFYLKYICENIMSQEQRNKTYIFNSYFYKRLTQKTSNKSDPAVTHAQVKKWTRGVDIFEKDFIIIPINEHCHWYLAIICFHGQPLIKLNLNEKEEEEDDEEGQNEDFVMKETSTEDENLSEKSQQDSIVETTDSKLESAEEGSPTKKINGDTSTVEPNDVECPMASKASTEEQQPPSQPPPQPAQPLQPPSQEESTVQNENVPPEQQKEISQPNPLYKQEKPTPDPSLNTAPDTVFKEKTKEEAKQANDLEEFYRPCILIFDSLIGSGHSRVFTNLRNYLTQEWVSRKPTEEPKVYDKDSMKGSYPKIPRQNNDCDCGVFLLQYAEFFFAKPIRNFKLPVHLERWFTVDSVTKKREDIKLLINKLAETRQHTVSTVADKKQKTKNKKSV